MTTHACLIQLALYGPEYPAELLGHVQHADDAAFGVEFVAAFNARHRLSLLPEFAAVVEQAIASRHAGRIEGWADDNGTAVRPVYLDEVRQARRNRRKR